VVNTNLTCILRRFRDIAFDRSTIATFCYLPLLGLAPSTQGFPWDDLHKLFCARQRMAKVPNAVQKLPKITTAWVGRASVTDDRQTDVGYYGRFWTIPRKSVGSMSYVSLAAFRVFTIIYITLYFTYVSVNKLMMTTMWNDSSLRHRCSHCACHGCPGTPTFGRARPTPQLCDTSI